jgi:tubulin polyglutamylase TTLL6/13
LIDSLKFDLRIYVLITGVNPLRAYIFKEGLARFATEEYVSPLGSNLNNLCMHLTNYAINKDSEGFIFNEDSKKDDIGHKRSLTAVFKQIDEKRFSDKQPTAAQIWEATKDIILKTLIAGHPSICHLYRSSKADDFENSLCF